MSILILGQGWIALLNFLFFLLSLSLYILLESSCLYLSLLCLLFTSASVLHKHLALEWSSEKINDVIWASCRTEQQQDRPHTDFDSLTHKDTAGNNVSLQFIYLWYDFRFLLTAVALLSSYSIHLLLKSSGIVGKLQLRCVCLDFSSK